jgi:hypothetical protein
MNRRGSSLPFRTSLSVSLVRHPGSCKICSLSSPEKIAHDKKTAYVIQWQRNRILAVLTIVAMVCAIWTAFYFGLIPAKHDAGRLATVLICIPFAILAGFFARCPACQKWLPNWLASFCPACGIPLNKKVIDQTVGAVFSDDLQRLREFERIRKVRRRSRVLIGLGVVLSLSCIWVGVLLGKSLGKSILGILFFAVVGFVLAIIGRLCLLEADSCPYCQRSMSPMKRTYFWTDLKTCESCGKDLSELWRSNRFESSPRS